jgi:tRNA(Ile)-lysidine synthetase-like protein
MQYKSLCEYFPAENPKICTSGKVPNAFKTFFKHKYPQKLAVSLSGGVDSMVSLWILSQLYSKCELHAIHVNYQNRDTCEYEVQFLQWWCNKINVHFHICKINIVRETYMKINRNFYEQETRKLRFKAYRNLQCPIILGHNYDDMIENVITNIASNIHNDNLCGMTNITIINDIPIYRPILNISKKDIVSYAKYSNIPYLKDSTPEWSRRGKLRDILIPTLNSVEPSFIKNLMKLMKT